MKKKRHRRILSLLIAVMLIFNVFMPIHIVNAQTEAATETHADSGDGTQGTDVIKIETEAEGLTDPENEMTEAEEESTAAEETSATDEAPESSEEETIVGNESTEETTEEVTSADITSEETSASAEETTVAVEPVSPVGKVVDFVQGLLGISKYDSEPKEVEKLLDYEAKVIVGTKEFVPDETLEFTDGTDIKIDFTFTHIPVYIDAEKEEDSENYVMPGDTAQIVLGKGLKIPSVMTPINLVYKGSESDILIGKATLTYNDDDQVVMNIAFDWDWETETNQDDNVLNGDTTNIEAGFELGLQYDASKADDDDSKKVIIVLDKSYYVTTPSIPVVVTKYSVSKEGTVNYSDGTINWKVKVDSDPAGGDLSGFSFSDALKDVGTYVDNSFEPTSTGGTFSYLNNVLSYVFPIDTTAPQTVNFKTYIPLEKLSSNKAEVVSNTAVLTKTDGSTASSDKATATLEADRWITKTGKEISNQDNNYTNINRAIEWSIIANNEKAELKDVIINDMPQTNGMTITSASYCLWDEAKDNWSTTEIKIEGGDLEAFKNGNYTIDSLNTKIKVIVITAVPDDTAGTVSKTSYDNKASISWKQNGTDGSATSNTASVVVGDVPFTKSGDQVTGENSDRKIDWTVTFDPRQQTGFGNSLVVYDLIVHGGSELNNLDSLTGWPSGLSAENIDQNLNQRYVENSLKATSAESTNTNVIQLKAGNEVVADLLRTEISGTKKTVITFQSQITNPEIFANNGSTNVNNTAMLFRADGITKVTTAPKTVTYSSEILNKEILKNTADTTTVSGINGSNIGTEYSGFNYQDKTAIFRLSVNADGLNFTDNSDDTSIDSGSVKVSDVLPQGWVLDTTFNDNKGYKIYEGTAGTSPSVTAAESEIDLNPIGSVEFIPILDPASITFTFTKLNKPYVILLKAKLTDEAYKNYLKNNLSQVKDTNKSTFYVGKWNITKEDTQSVTVKARVLDKTGTLNSGSQSYTWTVDYKPFDLTLDDVKIEDTLVKNLELPVQSDGNPVWDKIKVTKLNMDQSGNYKPESGTDANVDPSTCLTYDAVARTLRFNVPEIAQAYRLTYETYIEIDSGSVEIKNSVKLVGSAAEDASTEASDYVVYQSGWANIQLGGSVTIKKLNGVDGTPLSGAKFTIYASDGTTVLRRGTTDASGNLKLRAIPAGTYKMNETAAPEGFTPEMKTYIVDVDDSSGKIVTTVDGEAGPLTVNNFNSSTVGKLTIKKTVAGNGGDKEKAFTFKVEISAPGKYPYIGDGVSGGAIGDDDTISLKHGQSITIYNLPAGTNYTVSEEDYTKDGYDAPVYTGNQTGTIEADTELSVSVTNSKTLPGTLTISKTVTGEGAERKKEFNFHVTFDAAGLYMYEKYDNSSAVPESGMIGSGDSVQLADGESLSILGLPDGTKYTVNEEDYSLERYTTLSTNKEGAISTDKGITAAFINTYHKQNGSLTIRKTVTGTGADKTKQFNFTVTFNADGFYPYTRTGASGKTTGNVRSGDTFTLSDGESLSITGLPDGTAYTVTEDDYLSLSYETTAVNAQGVLYCTKEGVTAAFTNTFHRDSGSGGGGSSSGGPKVTTPDPTAPAESGTLPAEAPKPGEEMPTQPVYDIKGEVPLGYMPGPDGKLHTLQELYDIWGKVPLGYMVGIDGQLVPLGLPKTGEGTDTLPHYGLILLIADLVVFFIAAVVMRREKSEEEK